MAKILTVSRKSHHTIETLMHVFCCKGIKTPFKEIVRKGLKWHCKGANKLYPRKKKLILWSLHKETIIKIIQVFRK